MSPIKGSPAAISKLTKLMRISGSGYTLKEAVLYENELQLKIREKHGRCVRIALSPPGRGDSFLKTANFHISYDRNICEDGTEAPPELIASLSGLLVVKLKKLTYHDLEKTIQENDPEKIILAKEGIEREKYESEIALHRTWGKTSLSVKLIHNEPFIRDFECSIRINDPFVFIAHGDCECMFIRNYNYCEIEPVCFFNYPWPMGRKANGLIDGSPDKAYTTDIKETGVIMGGKNALSSLFETMAETDESKMVVIKITCVPMMAGDDTDSAVRSFKKSCAAPVYYSHQLHDYPVLQLFNEIGIGGKTKRKEKEIKSGRKVNLVGFRSGTALDELSGCLEEIGVIVNSRLIPDITRKDIVNYKDAKTQVFHSGAALKQILAGTLPSLPIKTISPAAPYGIERTWSWLESVSSAAGQKKQFLKYKEKHFTEIAEKWDAVRRESEKYRLAFVVADSELSTLTDTDNAWGIPLLPVIDEMGFGVDLIVYSESISRPSVPTPVIKYLSDKQRHKIHYFSNYGELSALLKEGAFQAVYSDVYYDKRLTRNGKSQFSMKFFEIGFSGAERTARRLRRVCQVGFYKRYAEFLSVENG